MKKYTKQHKIDRIMQVLDASPVALSAISIADIIREPWCMTADCEPNRNSVRDMMEYIETAAMTPTHHLWYDSMKAPARGLSWFRFVNASIADNAKRRQARKIRRLGEPGHCMPVHVPGHSAIE